MTSPFKLSVCPHDTAKNLLGWYTLNTYIQRHLGEGIHFEPQDNFLDERRAVLEQDFHLVYANPYSALRFAQEKGFVPIARPSGVHDETIVVARAGMDLPDRLTVASATDQLIIHELGVRVLRRLGIGAERITFEFVGNHLNAVKAVLHGEADVGFVFNETWAGISDSVRDELQILGESRDGNAFHCFMVAPQWADKIATLQHILCSMHRDAAGLRVLEDLKFKRFEEVSAGILAPLTQLLAA